MTQSAVIFSPEGTELTKYERRFFQKIKPFGFILFERNCKDKEQIKSLITDLRKIVRGNKIFIFIDQEGGTVKRLKSSNWFNLDSAKSFGNLYKKKKLKAKKILEFSSYIVASELKDLGIDANCAPVLDVAFKSTASFLIDRIFSKDPHTVCKLGEIVLKSYQKVGILPVIKHIPGHGRAKIDSHYQLPKVNCTLKELKKVDFLPFKKMSSAPFAMTAHISYGCINPYTPLTFSKIAIDEIIRKYIGFDGLLLSDDLNMKCLEGGLDIRVKMAYEAGCDIVMHCSGKMEEMELICSELRTIRGKTKLRTKRILSIFEKRKNIDIDKCREDLACIIKA